MDLRYIDPQARVHTDINFITSGRSVSNDTTSTTSVENAQTNCINVTNRNRRSLTEAEAGACTRTASRTTQKEATAKTQPSGQQHQGHSPQNQREKAQKQEPSSNWEWFTSPELRHLLRVPPPPGAPGLAQTARE